MTWTMVCKSEDLQEGQSHEILAQGEIIALFRHGGSLFALDGVCMHQGGPISRGKVQNCVVTCPWHGWQYELSSGCNATTGKPMLKTYEIRETSEGIEIDLPNS